MAIRHFPNGHSLAVGNFLAYKVAKMSFSRPEGDRDESWGPEASFLGIFFLPKTHPKTFDFSSPFTIKRQCSYFKSFSPWFYTLDLRLRGVDVAFQRQSTPIAISSHVLALFCFQHVCGFFQHISLLFTMIYCFDVVGLTFLGQDLYKFNVCAQIHILLGSLPCLYLDLRVYLLFALFILRSTCLCVLCHVYAQIYMFML